MTRFWKAATEAHRRFHAAGIDCAVIKSYDGKLEYNHGNVDVVADVPLLQAYQKLFADDFTLTRRDLMKYRLYERNKLMLVPNDKTFAKIHLHTNAGWHDVCFVSAEEILEDSSEVQIEGLPVRLPSRDLEARMFVLHIIFEQFEKKPRDQELLAARDYDAFAEEFSIPEREIAAVRDAGVGPLRLDDLRPIWKRYYQVRASQTPITLRNRFLHWGLTVVWRYRLLKKRFKSGRSKA